MRSLPGMDAFDKFLATTSQADLARRLGVSPVTVNQWKQRECNPSVDLMLALERLSDGAVPITVWPARRVDGRRRRPVRRAS